MTEDVVADAAGPDADFAGRRCIVEKLVCLDYYIKTERTYNVDHSCSITSHRSIGVSRHFAAMPGNALHFTTAATTS